VTHKQLGAKVDPEFEATVAGYSWSLSHGYARHYKKVDGKTRNMFGMQELVWSLKHGVTVKHLDHINGDRLDNRLSNLRPSTPGEDSGCGPKIAGSDPGSRSDRHTARQTMTSPSRPR